MSRGIIYYTNNQINFKLLMYCYFNLVNKCAQDTPIVSVVQQPDPMFANPIVVGPMRREVCSIYIQILKGALRLKTKYVFLCEHDCIYPPDYFTRELPTDINNLAIYNSNTYILSKHGFYKRDIGTPQSQLFVNREMLIENMRKRIEMVRSGNTGKIVVCEVGKNKWERKEGWRTEVHDSLTCCLDIRHDNNVSREGVLPSRIDYLSSIPPWGDAETILKEIDIRYEKINGC